MAKILVAYFSKTGNTRTMAETIRDGAADAGAEVDLMEVSEVDPGGLIAYDGFVIGSPTYYGLPAAEVKALFDESVALHGRLAGKAGAAFASAANVGGGNETTCVAILQMMLVHGMVAVGAAQGDHYGPVAIGTPDARSLTQCKVHGERTAHVAEALRAAKG